MVTITGIFASLALLSALIIVYFKWSFGYWNRRGVATRPATIPFGNATKVFLQKITCANDMKNLYLTMKSKGLKFCGYYFLTKPVLVLLDPQIIKAVLTKDFHHFMDHANYVNEKTDPLSAHLFFLKGLKWKNLRAKITPTFTSGKMKMFFQILLKCSDELLVVLDGMVRRHEAIDINQVAENYTIDVIGSSAFGIELNSLNNSNSELRKHVKGIFQYDLVGVFKHYLAASFPKIMDFLALPLTKPATTKYFMQVVKEIVTFREENNVVRNDFMHLLIQMKNNVKIQDHESEKWLNETSNGTTKESSVEKPLTIEELTAEAFSFFLAGSETSATALSFCLCELACNFDIQEKLRREVKSTLEKHDQNVTYEAIMEMTYMDHCLNETLRKYPPVVNLSRECTQRYQVPQSNLTLNKGDQIFIPLLGLHHDPEYYPDPEKFDPDRFLPENNSKRNPFTWLPFGEGPRICIGMRFGVMIMKVALTVLLNNYKFLLNSKTRVPLLLDPKCMAPRVQGGIWLNADRSTE